MILFVTFFLFSTSILHAQVVNCPQGTYDMGSEKGENDETPVHTVQLSGFKISAREITEAQYDSCVQRGKCTPAHYDDGKCFQWTGSKFSLIKVPVQFRKPSYPVVCVNWHQALAYCKSQGMTLPAEAQWEYAATSGVKRTYSWGDELPTVRNCTMEGSNHPVSVGSHVSNEWGLFDMTGNVWEWTSDFYSPDAYAGLQMNDPKGPDAGLYRVIRGGGWYSNTNQLRVSNRHWFTPDLAEVSIGFRCLRD